MKEAILGEKYTEDEARELVKELSSSGRLTQAFGFTADKYPYRRTGGYLFMGEFSLHEQTDTDYILVQTPEGSVDKGPERDVFVPKAKGDRGANYYKRYNTNKVTSVIDRPDFSPGRQEMSKTDQANWKKRRH